MPERKKPEEPPGGGRMSHDVMARAARLPVEGPAVTDTLAASGGLELPRSNGTDGAPAPEGVGPSEAAREPIPGEREADTAMGSQRGIVGTTGFGGDLPPTAVDSTLDEATRQDRELEGGGAASQRGTPRPGPDSEAYPGERAPDDDEEPPAA